MGHEELSVFVRWYKFTGWLLDTTGKFPKNVRFTFSSRLDNRALDILEKIIEAAYSRDKIQLLKDANLEMDILRVLIRLCHERRYISQRTYEYAVKEIYECGSMIGGWIKEQQKK